MNVIDYLIILAPTIALLDALITLYVHIKTITFHHEQTELINSIGCSMRLNTCTKDESKNEESDKYYDIQVENINDDLKRQEKGN